MTGVQESRGYWAVVGAVVGAVVCALVCAALALASGAAGIPEASPYLRPGPPLVRAVVADGGPVARSWPVKGRAGRPRPLVVRGWHPPPKPWAAGHRGVDLAAPRGSPVRAVAAGRVSFAGRVAGRGVVSVELAGTGRPPLRTTYEPVRPSVREGRRVRAGQRVGTVEGSAHCSGGCLHWGVRRGGRYVDPLSLLPDGLLYGGGSRLLPVYGVPLPAGGGLRAEDGRPPGGGSAAGHTVAGGALREARAKRVSGRACRCWMGGGRRSGAHRPPVRAAGEGS